MGKHGDGYLYQKRGAGCWRVRWTVQGKEHDESTGTTDYEIAKKIAKQKTACDSALGEVRALTARLERAKDEQMYLEAQHNPSLNLFRMIEAFKSCDIVRRKKNSEATIRGWTSLGNILIDRFGGNTEMRQLTREMVEEFMRDYETKVSAAQFNHVLQFFKRVWNVLSKYDSPTELKARLTESNRPWDYILPMKQGEVVGKKPFTPEQLKRIWRVLEEMNDPELTLLFDLARNTGARLHDLVSWKWNEHLTFETDDGKMKAILEWKPIKTKNSTGKLMIIPILDDRVVLELYKRFQERQADDEYILPRMLELYNTNKACPLTHLCQKVLIKAGIQTKVKVEGNSRSNCVYGIHSFRHTLVSELFQKGVDLGTIQHLYTGHGSSYITELYAHANMDKKVVDLSKLGRIDVKPVEPPKWIAPEMSEADKKAYDEIEVMDAPKPVKIMMKSMLQFRNKKDLTIIRDWLTKRIG